MGLKSERKNNKYKDSRNVDNNQSKVLKKKEVGVCVFVQGEQIPNFEEKSYTSIKWDRIRDSQSKM